MDKRSKVYQMFGPKLVEVLFELVFNQVNLLRTRTGLPPLTKDQLQDQIINNMKNTLDYDWMTELENYPP